MTNVSIGPLVSSIIGKSVRPSVIQFGWDGGTLNTSLERAFESFKLYVVPNKGHGPEDEEGAPAAITFCDPDILNCSPLSGHDFSVVDPEFEQLTLAMYMSLEGTVANHGLIVIPGGNNVDRCCSLLSEMAHEGTTKSKRGARSKVIIYETCDGKMIELL